MGCVIVVGCCSCCRGCCCCCCGCWWCCCCCWCWPVAAIAASLPLLCCSTATIRHRQCVRRCLDDDALTLLPFLRLALLITLLQHTWSAHRFAFSFSFLRPGRVL